MVNSFNESLKTKVFFLETRKLLKKKNNTYNLGIQNLLMNPELENYFEFFYSINGFSITINNNAKKRNTIQLIFNCISDTINYLMYKCTKYIIYFYLLKK